MERRYSQQRERIYQAVAASHSHPTAQMVYDALRRETESTAAHAADRLDKAGKALAQVNELLEQQGAAWERLSQEYLAGEEPPAQGEDTHSTDT